ncbi:NAD(P)/FAD-dependent oxidoreductase [Aeromicrobium sp. P5_D10]
MNAISSVDTIVIGGGPAGLQAALTLGRMRHTVLLVDSGDYRNGTVEHAHNLITHDGRSPDEIRELARKDVAAYPTVELRTGRVDSVTVDGRDFTAVVDGEIVQARTVVLATGMRDLLPDVPGLQEIWGVEAAQCPFCHGYEVADQPIAILGTNSHLGMYASMLGRVSRDLAVLTDGAEVDDENAAILAGLGARIISAPVLGVERIDRGVSVALDGVDAVEVAGVFVASATFEQSAPFAQQLGLALLPSGAIEVDVMGATSVPGVYAAGDLAHVAALPMPMPSLATATAAGLVAGSSCVRDLLGRR